MFPYIYIDKDRGGDVSINMERDKASMKKDEIILRYAVL